MHRHYRLTHHRLVIALTLIGLLGSLFQVSAQVSDTITESEFWSLMRQTGDALQAPVVPPEELARLRALWAGVRAVVLNDETQITVDLTWLTSRLEQADPAEREKLAARVQALLDYRASQVLAAEEGDPFAALNRVLGDSRFQYGDVTPTPPPPPDDLNLPDLPQPGVGFSQIVLIIGGMIVVLLIVAYVARGLQIQAVTSDEPLEPEYPQTSVRADELAATSETVRDYRAAVRYLYLSSLLMLDERGMIRYDRTLTNREHLQQIADQPQLHELLRPVVSTFDRVWYGFAPLNEIRYQEFRQNVERLRELAR